MNTCVWESMCERQEIDKKEKIWGIWAVDGVRAISRYVVVIASKIKVLHCFKHYSSNFL